MKTIQAIYENGVFRPTTPVDLPEGIVVRVEPEPVDEPSDPASALDEGTVHTPMEDPDLIELVASIRRERLPLPTGPSGPGRRSTAGRLADDPTWDEHLREVLDSRKSDVDREIPG